MPDSQASIAASTAAVGSLLTITLDKARLYRANVDAVTAYFARRSAEPQVVADLTADTFVAAITGFGSFDPRKGTPRAWVFGIARRVYAAHCETYRQQQHKIQRLAGRRDLDQDQVAELLDRIDAERAGRHLLTELALLPERDRAVVELVDIAGLRPNPNEAAAALGLPPGDGSDAADAGPRPPAQGSTAHNHEPDQG